MSEKPPSDPRFRPFRAGAWVAYVTVVTVFGMALVVSVFRSVLEMSPKHEPTAAVTLSPEECMQRAKVLWHDLDARRQQMASADPVRNVDNDWSAFRVTWLKSHRASEAACAVDVAGREDLKTVYAKLERAMDLYTTHAVQFAGEVGPTVDALKEALGESSSKH